MLGWGDVVGPGATDVATDAFVLGHVEVGAGGVVVGEGGLARLEVSKQNFFCS